MNNMEKSSVERKKEEIIDVLVDKYLHEQGRGLPGAGLSDTAIAMQHSREAGDRAKLKSILEGIFVKYMTESGGVPPTEQEFTGYVANLLDGQKEELPTETKTKKEKIIDALVEKYLQKQGMGFHKPVGVEQQAREAEARAKLEGVLEGIYEKYMGDSGGIPPTEQEFTNYVASKLG